jgi:hypothetical protein
MTRDEHITWEERSAMMEYDGGLSRPNAERQAFKIIQGNGGESEQLELLL